jgi:carbonic anhydrase
MTRRGLRPSLRRAILQFWIKNSIADPERERSCAMAVVDEVRAANERYAAGFAKGDLPMPPGRKVAVVACMDARLDPAKALGLEEGDAHVIRNAGGRAADALRSLVISQQLLGTNEVIVVHHTDCGMLTFDNATLQGICRDRLTADASDIDFLPFSDLEQSVRDDVALIRDSPLIPNDVAVHGFIYDVKTGRIDEVE